MLDVLIQDSKVTICISEKNYESNDVCLMKDDLEYMKNCVGVLQRQGATWVYTITHNSSSNQTKENSRICVFYLIKNTQVL